MKSPIPPDQSLVYVVDDDAAVRESLDSLIRSVGLRVETFSSGREFLRRAPHEGPACLVLDVRLPDRSGLELQRELAAGGCTLPIIFITGHGDIPMSVRAMKAGAVEFLTKPFRDQDLLDAIHAALERDRVDVKRRAELAGLRARHALLTPRECEVMDLVVQGMLNKQIAGRLGTSEITVKIQRGNAMKKMQAVSVAGLVRISEMLRTTDSNQTKV
ncbi:MAG TPA: response regulator transcription factor [Verrucomicrobiae bacterium]|nr:response regulator transcription factor [Verrucomicrobiae bacterium]